jgi:predicted small metal-binding protein
MAKVLRCRDVGFDCDAVVHADTDDEILAQVAAHATRDHGLEHVGDDVVAKVLASIRTE